MEYGEEETTVITVSSEKNFPLHSVFVDIIGFVLYVKLIKKLGYEKLYHELTKFGVWIKL